MIQRKIHPTNIIQGYKLASKEAVKFIKKNMAVKVDTLGKEALYNCCKTSMSSKLIGAESDFFAKLVVQAVKSIETKNWKGKPKYPISCINIMKCHGRSSLESRIIDGYVLRQSRAS